MKHILIPTDFSIKSLNIINNIVSKYDDQPLKITCLHLISMPTSITELLLIRRSKGRYEERIPSEFFDACQVIQNKYADRIALLDVKIEFGDTRKYLQAYLDANSIQKVVIANDHSFKNYFKESVDLLALLMKTTTPIEYLSVQSKGKSYTDMSVISMNSVKNVKQIKEQLSYATEE